MEDTTHILECRATYAVEQWNESSIRVKEWMYANNTCLDLSLLVGNALDNWKHKGRVGFDEDVIVSMELFQKNNFKEWM